MGSDKFFSIAHLITPEALHAAFRGLRKEASAGVDGVRYEEYEKDAARNIQQLHQRLKDGKYQAQPLRRVYIPKEDGKQRPISIPALEDKILQKAMVEVLNAIYEQDFLDCSYGFRPGRGPHQALDEVGRVICTRPTGWILEIDITAYFDSIVREQLMEMVEKRISDGSVLQLIRKWIKVGVIEEGRASGERNRYRAGADDQSAPGQYLPALRARRMVRGSGEAPVTGRSARDPFC
jgi:RNA-directed DNA polymerase